MAHRFTTPNNAATATGHLAHPRSLVWLLRLPSNPCNLFSVLWKQGASTHPPPPAVLWSYSWTLLRGQQFSSVLLGRMADGPYQPATILGQWRTTVQRALLLINISTLTAIATLAPYYVQETKVNKRVVLLTKHGYRYGPELLGGL
jgi:hypothetical protein